MFSQDSSDGDYLPAEEDWLDEEEEEEDDEEEEDIDLETLIRMRAAVEEAQAIGQDVDQDEDEDDEDNDDYEDDDGEGIVLDQEAIRILTCESLQEQRWMSSLQLGTDLESSVPLETSRGEMWGRAGCPHKALQFDVGEFRLYERSDLPREREEERGQHRPVSPVAASLPSTCSWAAFTSISGLGTAL